MLQEVVWAVACGLVVLAIGLSRHVIYYDGWTHPSRINKTSLVGGLVTVPVCFLVRLLQ